MKLLGLIYNTLFQVLGAFSRSLSNFRAVPTIFSKHAKFTMVMLNRTLSPTTPSNQNDTNSNAIPWAYPNTLI